MRLLKNVITGKKYSIMNKMMNNWILHTKFVLKCKSFVRSILIRKSTTYLRLGFKRWHDIWIQDSIGRRCVVRMSMIVSKQRYLLAMTKWKREIYLLKIEDALCLGHAAMRKTKVDMARRLYSLEPDEHD